MNRRQYCARVRQNLGPLVVGVVVAIAASMLFNRSICVSLDSSKSYIEPAAAKPGERIAIVWQANAYSQCQGMIIPRLIDSTGRIFEYDPVPAVYHDLMVDNPGTFTKFITLPTVITPGRARYDAVVFRWRNFLQKHFWPMREKPFPIWFEILPPAPH